ncbi:MAG: hypothetical protein EA422_01335, partial [Gemmatimonadales bacterium]
MLPVGPGLGLGEGPALTGARLELHQPCLVVQEGLHHLVGDGRRVALHPDGSLERAVGVEVADLEPIGEAHHHGAARSRDPDGSLEGDRRPHQGAFDHGLFGQPLPSREFAEDGEGSALRIEKGDPDGVPDQPIGALAFVCSRPHDRHEPPVGQQALDLRRWSVRLGGRPDPPAEGPVGAEEKHALAQVGNPDGIAGRAARLAGGLELSRSLAQSPGPDLQDPVGVEEADLAAPGIHQHQPPVRKLDGTCREVKLMARCLLVLADEDLRLRQSGSLPGESVREDRLGHPGAVGDHGLLRWSLGCVLPASAQRQDQGKQEDGGELVRYCARGPLALERLHAPAGNGALTSPEARLVYRLPEPDLHGCGELRLTPLELLERLARLVPPPRIHRHRYHGVLAPNARLRSAVVSIGRPAADEPPAHAEPPPSPRPASPSVAPPGPSREPAPTGTPA